MHKLRAALAAGLTAVVLSIATTALAVLPDGGWYWNPAESGRGFNIEIQDNLLFMSGFVYDASGKQVWLVSGGTMTSDTRYSGEIYQTSAGQCLGCAYAGFTESLYGTVAITFTSTTTASMTINGTSISLQRQVFGFDFGNVATPLLGEWAITSGDSTFPLYSGERIALRQTSSTTSGLVAAGNRAGESGSSDVAIGYYAPSIARWVVLLDSSSSYYRFYVFNFTGLNRIEGDMYLYLKTSSPGSSDYFIGHRIKSGAALAGKNAPGTGKAAVAGDRSVAALTADSMQYQRASGGTGTSIDTTTAEIARSLALEVERLRVGRPD